MGMNDTPKGERVHIAIFGKRNVGKSSLINAITGQDISVVSNQKGTTTDPVYKAMELLPIGPVMFIDTPGLDDEGDLGELRVEKAKEILRKTDVALIVADGIVKDDFSMEQELEQYLSAQDIPYLWVWNKCDLGMSSFDENKQKEQGVCVSTITLEGIDTLKEMIPKLLPKEEEKVLVRDLVECGDVVILVVPIDKAAPKGRLILPQQQVIRDLLEKGAFPLVTRETELEEVFQKLSVKPKMVITDSQVFAYVNKVTPKDIPLTSFSILMARYKGDLQELAESASCLHNLHNGDTILMAEGCTHHRQCVDIGTVKLPNWIKEYTGKELSFETSSGGGFPKDLKKYAMVVHCGGCMLNSREMKYRMKEAKQQGVPMVNYGILIAYMKGIIERSLGLFPEIKI